MTEVTNTELARDRGCSIAGQFFLKQGAPLFNALDNRSAWCQRLMPLTVQLPK